MAKRLFRDNNLYYSDIAKELDIKATKLIRPLMLEFVKKGYDIRDICYVVTRTVIDIEVEHLLVEQHKRVLAKRKEKYWCVK